MDESALLANIATILAKDLLVDVGNTKVTQQSRSLQSDCLNRIGAPSYPLLESDDEASNFFIKQQNLLHSLKGHPIDKQRTLQHKRKAPQSNISCAEQQQKRKKHHDSITNETMRKDSALEVNLLNEFNPNAFENYLHLSKTTFLKIFKSLRHLFTRNEGSISAVPPQTVFSLALWKLATDEHFEEIARRFQIPLHSCHLVIRKFWHIVSENYESFIRWPNSQRMQNTTLNGFQAMPVLNAFPQLFGIIAKRRLDIFLESGDEEVSVILQVICNAEEKIIDCFVEFANAYSFDSSPIGQTLDLNTQTIPAGSYIIGDSSFPLKGFLMRPFEIACFHRETVFNSLMQPALAMGQRVLDNMAERFHSLYALEAKDINEVRKVLETVCSLHNLCIDHQDSYVNNRQAVPTAGNNVTATQKSVIMRGSEQNQQGREARLQLMDRIMI